MRRALQRDRERIQETQAFASQAAKEADLAAWESKDAKQAFHVTRLAGIRVDNVVSVLDDRYPYGVTDTATVLLFGRCLVSGLLWENRREANGAEIIVEFVMNVLPFVDEGDVRSIIAKGERMTNAEVGRLLQVPIADVERLSLSMISPCDMPPGEFDIYCKERRKRRDRERKEAAARSSGKQTMAELRAARDEKKAWFEALAKAHNKSVAQVRRDLRSGKIPTRTENAKLSSARDSNRAEFTFASSLAGATKAPRATNSNSPNRGRSADFFSTLERQAKITSILRRAADRLKTEGAITGAAGALRAYPKAARR
jgi:hypothetical protein